MYLIEALSRRYEGSITALERREKESEREREERCFQADFKQSLGERSGSIVYLKVRAAHVCGKEHWYEHKCTLIIHLPTHNVPDYLYKKKTS